MRAPGDHETNASPAPRPARPAKPGPLRHLPPQRAVVLSGNPTHSPPPPRQPKLLDHDPHPCPEARPRGRPEPGRPPAGSRPVADGNRLYDPTAYFGDPYDTLRTTDRIPSAASRPKRDSTARK